MEGKNPLESDARIGSGMSSIDSHARIVVDQRTINTG